MLIVSPEFDTDTQTWFLGSFEASTLRELQKQVGQDVRFLDYYPIGSARAIIIRKTRIQEIKVRAQTATAAPKVSEPRQVRRSAVELVALRNEVVKLSEAGLGYTKISLTLNCTKGTVAGIVRRWKRKAVKSVCEHGTPPGSSCCARSENWPG
jgi:hypothetical protein